jgi:hypothetical protein
MEETQRQHGRSEGEEIQLALWLEKSVLDSSPTTALGY